MQAAIVCLVILAYGDSSDYIPASAATATKTRNKTAEFADSTVQAIRRTRPSVAERQQELDRETRAARNARPQPLHYVGDDFRTTNPVRTAATSDVMNAAAKVKAAQYQFEDNWPNRPIDGAGYGKNLAATDPTDVNSQRPFSLATPNAGQQPSARTTPENRAGPIQTAQNTAARKRYIPANAGSQYATDPKNEGTFPTTSARPQYVSNDTSNPAGSNPGDFGYAGNPPREPAALKPVDQPPPASFGSETKFDLGAFNKQYRAPSQPTANGYLPPKQQPQSNEVTRRPAGSNYLPPNSPAISTAQNPQSNALPAASSPSATAWPPAGSSGPGFNSVVPQPKPTDRSIADSTQPSASSPAFRPSSTPANHIDLTGASPTQTLPRPQQAFQRNPQDIRGGSFMTLLALFGSIGLNLYLGWIAWDTYNRYQDLVADIRYTSPRRDTHRDEYVERVA